MDALEPALRRLARVVPDLTPARVFRGRTGSSYRTASLLSLREDHAAARDAVQERLDPDSPAFAPLLRDWGLFALNSRATSTAEYLRRPDLGRRLAPESLRTLRKLGDHDRDVQIVVGDGLSARAVATQVPVLLPQLARACAARGWTLGRPFVVRHCRVGIMNDVGETLSPRVVVLLIGERPGLATAEAISAYLAFRPGSGDTDARRNLVASIHRNGLSPSRATRRIVDLIAAIQRVGASGTLISEPVENEPGQLPELGPG